MIDEDVESIILRFERSWRLHGRADIGGYLGGFPASGPERYRLLVELVCVDLEYRWRRLGDDLRPTLADYIREFSELVSLDRLPPVAVVKQSGPT